MKGIEHFGKIWEALKDARYTWVYPPKKADVRAAIKERDSNWPESNKIDGHFADGEYIIIKRINGKAPLVNVDNLGTVWWPSVHEAYAHYVKEDLNGVAPTFSDSEEEKEDSKCGVGNRGSTSASSATCSQATSSAGRTGSSSPNARTRPKRDIQNRSPESPVHPFKPLVVRGNKAVISDSASNVSRIKNIDATAEEYGLATHQAAIELLNRASNSNSLDGFFSDEDANGQSQTHSEHVVGSNLGFNTVFVKDASVSSSSSNLQHASKPTNSEIILSSDEDAIQPITSINMFLHALVQSTNSFTITRRSLDDPELFGPISTIDFPIELRDVFLSPAVLLKVFKKKLLLKFSEERSMLPASLMSRLFSLTRSTGEVYLGELAVKCISLMCMSKTCEWYPDIGDVTAAIISCGAPKGIFSGIIPDEVLDARKEQILNKASRGSKCPLGPDSKASGNFSGAVTVKEEKKNVIKKEDAPKRKRPDNMTDQDMAAARKKKKPAQVSPTTMHKFDNKCILCDVTGVSLKHHPYVRRDGLGRSFLLCNRCCSNWHLYRNAALDSGNLFAEEGGDNEEYCAVCSQSPPTIVLCSSCVRSYCNPCLQKIVRKAEFKAMNKNEDWNCMDCQFMSLRPTTESVTSMPKRPIRNTNPLSSSSLEEGAENNSGNRVSVAAVDTKAVSEDAKCDSILAMRNWLHGIKELYQDKTRSPKDLREGAQDAACALLKYLMLICTLDELKAPLRIPLRTATAALLTFLDGSPALNELLDSISSGQLFGRLPLVSILRCLPRNNCLINKLYRDIFCPIGTRPDSSQLEDIEKLSDKALLFTECFTGSLRKFTVDDINNEPDKILLHCYILSQSLTGFALDTEALRDISCAVGALKGKMRGRFGASVISEILELLDAVAVERSDLLLRATVKDFELS